MELTNQDCITDNIPLWRGYHDRFVFVKLTLLNNHHPALVPYQYKQDMPQYLLSQITLKLNYPDKANEIRYTPNPIIAYKFNIIISITYKLFKNITLEKAYALCLYLSAFNDSLPILNHNVTSVASKSDA